MENFLLGAIMLGDMRPLMLPALLFLFIIWLIYRVEDRVAKITKDEIYKNFPFFQTAVNNFQQKLDYLSLRVEELDSKINKLQIDKT